MAQHRIHDNFRDEEREHISLWVAETYPRDGELPKSILVIQLFSDARSSTDMQDTVRNCSHGWDSATQGVVSLGFALLDSHPIEMLVDCSCHHVSRNTVMH